MDTLYRNMSEGAKSGMKYSDLVNEALDFLLSDPDAYKRLVGKLSIGVTEFPLK